MIFFIEKFSILATGGPGDNFGNHDAAGFHDV